MILWTCLAIVACVIVANTGMAIYLWRKHAPEMSFLDFTRMVVRSKREPQ